MALVDLHLTDAEWAKMEPHLPEVERQTGRRGRPFKPAREVMEAVLWVLVTGARWKDLPKQYPPYQTCHRRFLRWCCDGTLARMLRAVAEDLRQRGVLKMDEAFIDATFVKAKKGALRSA